MEKVSERTSEPAAETTATSPSATPAPTLGTLTPSGVVALQAAAGNRAVTAMLSAGRGVFRSPPNATLPPPVSSQTPPAEDPEVIYFEGKALRFDREVVLKVLKAIETTSGINGRSGFISRFKSANPLTLFRGNERQGLYKDIQTALDEAAKQLDHEHEEFCKGFQSTAEEAARGILDESKKKLEAEYQRFGLSYEMVGGDPGNGVPGRLTYKMGNKGAGAQLKTAAKELLPLATTVEATGRASAVALEKFEKASAPDPFGLTTKPLFEESEAKRKRWQEAQETYEKERKPRIATQPSLAMYADEPGAAEKLRKLVALSDEDLGDQMGREIRQRLDNIAEVRPEIGKSFNIWNQPHLRRVTLDQMNATPLQREVVDRKARSVAVEGGDKTLFALLAIGLGLLSALPTGGVGLMAGIGAAAAVAGAGLALYQVGHELGQYSLAAAANATDFDKAKAISDNSPDTMGLALAIVGAIGDVFAAAHAFKALKSAYVAAKAGDVKAALQFVENVERVGLEAGARQKVVAEAVSGLSEASVEQVGKTMAKSGGQLEKYMQKMAAAASHSTFQQQIVKARELMENVVGRIPDTAKKMLSSGKVQEFTEANLIKLMGPDEGKRLWKAYDYADGLFVGEKDVIFLRASSPDELAGTLIHEATHRVGSANPFRGDDFISEAVAEFAERDFYNLIYSEGGPLAGKKPTSPHITNLRKWSDEELLADIERRYYAAKKDLPPEKRDAFRNVTNRNADEILKEVFKDIAADYEKSLPHK